MRASVIDAPAIYKPLLTASTHNGVDILFMAAFTCCSRVFLQYSLLGTGRELGTALGCSGRFAEG